MIRRVSSMAELNRALYDSVGDITTQVETKMIGRSYRASNELRNSALYVLRGQRSGRIYRLPGVTYSSRTGKVSGSKSYYRASAPGEPPAARTGLFRLSWRPVVKVTPSVNGLVTKARIESGKKVGNYLLGNLLEGGTSNMAPRPYKKRIQERALVNIRKIYREKYLV